MTTNTFTPPARDDFKPASPAASEKGKGCTLGNAPVSSPIPLMPDDCTAQACHAAGGVPAHLKVFTSAANNVPVAWLVDARGSRYSEFYHGPTIEDAKQNLHNSLAFDKVFQKSVGQV